MSDFDKRTYYISGPPFMVSAIEKEVRSLGISSHRIKTDFFPGFA